MEEEGPGSAENDAPVAEPQPRHDFSHVQGFQVVGREDQGARDEAWREALRLELEVRAERLRQSVDAAIVLSNDGIIRWLGDPVAKLSLGPDVLNPSAVVLADDSLPDASRVTIKTRVDLWIAATTRRLLAPLFALESVQEGSEIVRDLARELVRSLGVLEREPIKAKIRTLTQDDRSELRKQGVRFGAYYLFLPTLLKPAARGLALQLWALQGSGDASELLRTLGPIASSGRTSLPTDPTVGKDGYRVAGYRACGERIVRVDVVERLAGMIRSAIVGDAPGGAEGVQQQRPSKGFVVSGAMTSLTGCAGEAFASILRSLGFRSVEMKRSEFFGPPSNNANEVLAQPGAAAEPAEDRPSADEQTSPPLSVNDADDAAQTVLAAPITEPLSPPPGGLDAAVSGAETAFEGVDTVAEAADGTAEDDDTDAEAADGSPEDDVGEDALSASVEVESAAKEADSTTEDTASAVSDPADSAPTADGAVQAAPSETPDEAAKDADVIIVWRPDHRRTSPRRERDGKRSRSEGHRHSEPPASQDVAPNWRREAPTRPPRRPNPANLSAGDEKRRQRPKDYDMARATPAAAPQPKAKVDPNSPFAKLLELRSLLEEQAKKRR